MGNHRNRKPVRWKWLLLSVGFGCVFASIVARQLRPSHVRFSVPADALTSRSSVIETGGGKVTLIGPVDGRIHMDYVAGGSGWKYLIAGAAGVVAAFLFHRSGDGTQKRKSLRRLVLEHPAYPDFLEEDPQREFIYQEDLPEIYTDWLSKRP